MTNGDKIRSMNDRQLAKYINENTRCIDCPAGDYCGSGATKKPCLAIIEEWLKEGAE